MLCFESASGFHAGLQQQLVNGESHIYIIESSNIRKRIKDICEIFV